MKNILLDSSGDILLANQKSYFVEGLEAYAQNLTSFLHTIEGEIFTDDSIGLPWSTTLMDKSIDIGIKITLIKNKILNLYYIQSIEKFVWSFGQETRSLSITARFKTPEGILDYQTGLNQG